MKIFKLLIILAVFTFTACGDDDSNSGLSQGSLKDKNIVGKTLTFYKSDGNFYFSASHYAEGVTLSIASTDYAKYPPSYSFSYFDSNSATYNLSFTTKTYIPYYQSYNYAKFEYRMKLSFITESSGTYQADYYNVNGLYKTLTGRFTLY